MKKRFCSSKVNNLIEFRYPKKQTQEYLSEPFCQLGKRLGTDVTNKIMEIMDYNEHRDTRYCYGFRCSEKIFKTSRNFYCKKCHKSMKKEGFIFCKICRMLKGGFCKKTKCFCDDCYNCGEHYSDCLCLSVPIDQRSSYWC